MVSEQSEGDTHKDIEMATIALYIAHKCHLKPGRPLIGDDTTTLLLL